MELQDLINKVRAYHPAADFSLIEKAYRFSSTTHSGQKRQSGEPFLIHPLQVAGLIAELKLDTASIVKIGRAHV